MSTDAAVEDVSGTSEKTSSDPGMNAFARSVLQVMDQVEYRLCVDREDLEDIYRLRYEAYLASGMIKANALRIVEDEFDGLENGYCYGIYYNDNLVSTVRLHHITAAAPQAPSTKVFGDILGPRLAAGESFVDPSRFAVDPQWSAHLRVFPYITLRLALISTYFFEPTSCLTAIKEEHAGFYKRMFLATPLIRGRIYPGLTCPVDLWESKYPFCADQGAKRFAFFRSTPLERRMLFTKPKDGYRAPLTILPSTKFLDRAA
jgi:N-acyl-L-homoserine lactone synthetase